MYLQNDVVGFRKEYQISSRSATQTTSKANGRFTMIKTEWFLSTIGRRHFFRFVSGLSVVNKFVIHT